MKNKLIMINSLNRKREKKENNPTRENNNFRRHIVVFKILESRRITPPGSFRNKKLINKNATWKKIISTSLGSDAEIFTRNSFKFESIINFNFKC
jgi:fumarylacetoacetate (FAA) hydrolase family protein